ncbi:MAG TPA: magnesium transporter [Terriglobales bacterium]|nr:magnesium transporter [Terriglobales bacterium]
MRETLIENLREALGHRGRSLDPAAIGKLVGGLHPSDVAVVLDELTLPEAEQVFRLLDNACAAEALTHAAPATCEYLLRTSPPARVVALLNRLPADEAAEIVSEAGDEGRQLLALMPNGNARDVRQLLDYPEQTAGRLMSTRFAAVPLGISAGRALDYVRASAATAETIAAVYVLDGADRLAGVFSIRDLLRARPEQPIAEIMTRDVVAVHPETDQQEVAQIISRYDLPAVPVTDAQERPLGIVTVDDVLDVVAEEFNEDIASLIGADAAEMDRRTPAQVARLRLPWLLGTMLIELGAGGIIAQFDNVLRQVILLASFMPVISAVSGNVGLQAATMVVRGLDTGHVTLANWAKAVRRELATALAIALVAGGALAAVAVLWSRRIPFGFVVGAAMMCSIITAGLMGTVIPMLSKRFGFDPATTAGPFETAFQDVIGFSVFLGMATWLSRFLA